MSECEHSFDNDRRVTNHYGTGYGAKSRVCSECGMSEVYSDFTYTQENTRLKAEFEELRLENLNRLSAHNQANKRIRSLMAENERLREQEGRYEAECQKYRRALIAGLGADLNEMVSRNMPLEWSPSSGMGHMAAALNCKTVEEFRALVNPQPQSAVKETDA